MSLCGAGKNSCERQGRSLLIGGKGIDMFECMDILRDHQNLTIKCIFREDNED